MKIGRIEMRIVELAPAIDVTRIGIYIEWLNDLVDFTPIDKLFNLFEVAFPDLSSGERYVVFGIWLAMHRWE